MDYLFSLVSVVELKGRYSWHISPEYVYEFNLHNIFIEESITYTSEEAALTAFRTRLKQKLADNPNIQLDTLF